MPIDLHVYFQSALVDIRCKYFSHLSLKQLFEEVNALHVIDFITETNFHCILKSCCPSFILA